jgi:hypothetical protein
MAQADPQTNTIKAEFAARIDKIRARVALKLVDKMQQTDAALSQMVGGGSDAAEAVETAYRWLHDVSGIGPTIGFDATGRQARSCADILVVAFRAQRGLSPDELELLGNSLESLRIAALSETHSTDSDRRPTL